MNISFGAVRDERLDVMEVVSQFTFLMDHGKAEEMSSCFTSSVNINGNTVPLDSMIKIIAGIQSKYAHTQHLTGNSIISCNGDVATAKTQVRAMHKKKPEHGGDIYHMIGWYDDKLVRTPDGWRIAERILNIDWEEGEKAPNP